MFGVFRVTGRGEIVKLVEGCLFLCFLRWWWWWWGGGGSWAFSDRGGSHCRGLRPHFVLEFLVGLFGVSLSSIFSRKTCFRSERTATTFKSVPLTFSPVRVTTCCGGKMGGSRHVLYEQMPRGWFLCYHFYVLAAIKKSVSSARWWVRHKLLT